MPESPTIYEASIPLADLKAVAGVAKALNDDVTIQFGTEERGVRFWCKDEQKKCAMVGVLDVAEHEGSITLRVPSKNLADMLSAFAKGSTLSLRVDGNEADDGLSLTITDGASGDQRVVTVTEASTDDAPYAGKSSTSGSCQVDLKALGKVLAAYKKQADVVEVKIKGSILEVSYTSRQGKDSWKYTSEQVKGHGSGKFSTVLLAAAVTACKSVDSKAQLVMSATGPLRLNTLGETIGCRVYVVASKPL